MAQYDTGAPMDPMSVAYAYWDTITRHLGLARVMTDVMAGRERITASDIVEDLMT